MAIEPAPSDPRRSIAPSAAVLAEIRENVEQIRGRIAAAAMRTGRDVNRVRLVAVSKTFGPDRIVAALEAGLTNVGENRVQEATEKIAVLAEAGYRPAWHLVGHLQSNKARGAVEHFAIIHSVDSVHLAARIDQLASGRFPVLLQLNLGREASKSGFLLPRQDSPLVVDEAGVEGEDFADAFERISRFEHVEVRGLMTIAPQVTSPEDVRPLFRQLRALAEPLGLPELSMGMTEDFEVAVEEGATLIRLGRAIFGERTAARTG